MSNETPDRFANWLEPRSGGLYGLSMAALVTAATGVVLAMLFMIKQSVLGMLIVLALTALVVSVVFTRFPDGRTLMEKISDHRSLARRRAAGETMYVTGALSALPPEISERLPGALVDVETISGTDGRNRPYTLLHHRHVNRLAAVFACSPNGAAMQEQGVVNAGVANFGGWVSSLSVEEGLSGATIVVDSASESSAGMVQTIRDAAAPHAPAFAREVIEDAAGTLPARTSTVNVYATLVYDLEALGGTRNDLSPAVAEIAARMPAHSEQLTAAGGGLSEPVVEDELSRIALLAYQPGRDQEFALDTIQGHTAPRPFAQAGPGFLDDSAGRVTYHDGVASMTLMMTSPPGAHITARSLDRLFGPNPKFLRKRVAIFYRPVDPGAAAKLVDKQVRNAQWRMDTRKSRPTSFDKHARAVAERTEQDLASGARLSMFSVMVTVTFEATEKAHRDAVNQVKSLMNQTLMTYRFVEHAGSAAFHTTLPFGVLPWVYSHQPLWLEGAR